MGWYQVGKPKSLVCEHCKAAAWKGAVWLRTRLGVFCSSRCFQEHGGDVWEGERKHAE